MLYVYMKSEDVLELNISFFDFFFLRSLDSSALNFLTLYFLDIKEEGTYLAINCQCVNVSYCSSLKHYIYNDQLHVQSSKNFCLPFKNVPRYNLFDSLSLSINICKRTVKITFCSIGAIHKNHFWQIMYSMREYGMLEPPIFPHELRWQAVYAIVTTNAFICAGTTSEINSEAFYWDVEWLSCSTWAHGMGCGESFAC